MMSRSRFVAALAVVLIAVCSAAAVLLGRQAFFGPKTITAYFSSGTGIYAGDEVRVAGVKVGTIAAVEANATGPKLTLKVDRDVPIPAEAKAVIVAQNLISARYIQLAPAYESSGPTMADGAVIPVQRTAVPVEWDQVKDQLMRLATDLGPGSQVSTPAVARFIDSAANALDGNGDKLRQTLAQLSGLGRVLADGSGNLVDIIKNLQSFVTALRDSGEQIMSFQDRFASLSSVLDDNRSDLDAALQNLSVAVVDVQGFIAESKDPASEQIRRLANVTQNLVDHKTDLENILHVAPNAIANGYQAYNPTTGGTLGTETLTNFADPVGLVCSSIGAIENTTAPETAKLCAQYLGPALRLLNFNQMPIPTNPYLMPSASPDDIIYSDPALAPGGAGPAPGPPETPPAVSAYTGLNGDVPPPAGYGQPPAVAPGPSAPDHLPAAPSPALYPGAPVPISPSLTDLLLPAERPTP